MITYASIPKRLTTIIPSGAHIYEREVVDVCIRQAATPYASFRW